MSEPVLTEPTAWGYAQQRTINATKTLRFWFFDTVLGAIVAAATLLVLLLFEVQSVWVLAGLPTVVGIAWLFAGVLAIFVCHLFWAPYRQRDALRGIVAEYKRQPAFPDLAIEKTHMEQRVLKRPDNSAQLIVIVHRLRITNREQSRVSLGFRMLLSTQGTVRHMLSDIPNANIPPGIVGIASVPWLSSPLDIHEKSSVTGNIAFSTYLSPENANRPMDDRVAEMPELEVTEYLTDTSTRFSPSTGYPSPDHHETAPSSQSAEAT